MSTYLRKFESKKDCAEYIKWLAENDLDYYLDDDPSEILWVADLTEEQASDLQANHDALWDVGSPWDLMDEDRALWDLYRRAENPLEDINTDIRELEDMIEQDERTNNRLEDLPNQRQALERWKKYRDELQAKSGITTSDDLAR